MATVQLDTVADGVYGDTGESAGKVITDGWGVTYEVVTEHGPGGGNPVICFTGPVKALKAMVVEHYGQDTVNDYNM